MKRRGLTWGVQLPKHPQSATLHLLMRRASDTSRTIYPMISWPGKQLDPKTIASPIYSSLINEATGVPHVMHDYTLPYPRVHKRKPNRQHLYNTSVSSSLPPSATSSPICRKTPIRSTTAPPISSLVHLQDESRLRRRAVV
jgi:hypothetical protein